MLIRSLVEFVTCEIILFKAYSYNFVPFHNQPLRESKLCKLSALLVEGKVLNRRGGGRYSAMVIYLSLFIYSFFYTHLEP